MCSFMLICQCCFAIVKVLLKKVTYILTYLCHFWWKSIKKCDRESAHGRTHRYTDRLTDANQFYNLSHAICYIYATDNKMLSYRRETALQGTLVLAESGRLELRDNILLIAYCKSGFNHCDIIGQQSYRIRWETQNKGYYIVQDHSRSSGSVQSESTYATSY